MAVGEPRLHNGLMSAAYGTFVVAALVVGSIFGRIHTDRVEPRVVIWTATAVFAVAGIAATSRLARWLGHAVGSRTLPATGRVFRLIASVAGYVIVLSGTLGLVSVPIDHLLAGGVLTGVVLGIAAQQVLGNVFAGAVLLLAHPFGIGDHIRVRSGALGGQFDGVVRGMNLTYVTLRTDEGPLNVPNSGMLAAAVGPWKKAVVTPAAGAAAPDDGARDVAAPRKTRRG
jgi:small-conductance mechanosensitive channel